MNGISTLVGRLSRTRAPDAGLVKGLTNPPLLYLFAAAMVRLVGWGSALSLVAGTFALLNAVSLVILWRCAARVLSLGGSLLVMAWIATLPAFVTTAVVSRPTRWSFCPSRSSAI